MHLQQVLKLVFPLLEASELARCMEVSKQWREIALDDYLWRCLCGKRWPSMCKKPSPNSQSSYYKLFKCFYKRQPPRELLPPRLSLKDLEFYIDIWAEGRLIFSEVVSGPVLESGIKNPPEGICEMLRMHLQTPDYKMMVPVEPRFTVPLSQTVTVSVFVGRKDCEKIACIINNSLFDYIDRTAYRALAFDYLDFSPKYPFVSGIRAWMSLLFMDGDGSSHGVIDVFGIEMDFCDAANTEDEVLWLLDMLDWK